MELGNRITLITDATAAFDKEGTYAGHEAGLRCAPECNMMRVI